MDIKKRGEIMTDSEAYLAMDQYLNIKLNGKIHDMYKAALQSAIEMAHCEEYATKKIAELERKLAKLRDKLRWIPVEERLPDHIKDVLCLGHFGGKTVASKSFKNDGWFLHDKEGHVIKVNLDEFKYWMEIPELGDGE
jgi:hypothetical protein